MKKYKSVIIVFVVVVLLGVVICNLPNLYFSYVSRWKYQVEEFDSFENDFKLMTNFTKDYFALKETASGMNNALYVGYDAVTENYTLWNDNNEIDVSKDVQTSLNIIARKAFNRNLDSGFHKIVYYKEKISFEIENGQYSLVYSYDDEKPHFDDVGKNKRIYTKRIKENWYHVLFVNE